MLLTPIGVSIIMQHPSAHIEPAFPSFGWNATLRRGLTDALAEAIGMEIEPPELPEPTAPEWPWLVDYLVEYLDIKCPQSKPTTPVDSRSPPQPRSPALHNSNPMSAQRFSTTT